MNYEAYKAMRDRNYFGCMMVETGRRTDDLRSYKKLS